MTNLPIPPDPPVEAYALPASFAQERLWFLDELEPNSPLYNIPTAVSLDGDLDVAALRESVQELVRRHEALRTTLRMVDGQLHQIVVPTVNVPMDIVDLSDLPAPERQDAARAAAVAEARHPFDLARGPLLRLRLLRLASREHLLLVTLHHSIADGRSMGTFFADLVALYNAAAEGRPADLPPLPLQYADFAVWQREWLAGAEGEAQITYWQEHLADVPRVLDLPTDYLRPAGLTTTGARLDITLPSTGLLALEAFARREELTPFMVLLTALAIVLHRYSDQDELLLGVPVSLRPYPDLDGVIGLFVNTLAIRCTLAGSPSGQTLLRRMRAETLAAYSHHETPFEQVVAALHPTREASRAPLVQVLCVLEDPAPALNAYGGLTLRPVPVHTGTAKVDLTVAWQLDPSGDGTVRGWIEYNTALFAPETIARLAGHLDTILAALLADLVTPVNSLPLLTPAEREQALVLWNDTARPYPAESCVHELFEEQAARAPASTALICEAQQLSYDELNRRANRLARYLRRCGVGPGILVGICMERSLDMVVGLLGILKAGGAYLPLDPEYPQARLAFMLQDARAPILLTETRLRDRWLAVKVPTICLDLAAAEIQREPDDNLSAGVRSRDLAYVIYTSGSTGIPKGVMIEHRSIVRLLFGVEYVRLDPSQAFLHMAPISFDAATFEIWGALMHGARCVLLPERLPTPAAIGAAIRAQQGSIVWLTASLFNAIVDEDATALEGLAQLLIGGEALSVSHVRHALSLLPRTEIINGYGPTESTTFTCCHRITPRDVAGTNIPIGRPIANTRVYLLDRRRQIVPIGVPGELYIGGDGLARGYLNRPGLTADYFVSDPFSNDPEARLYRTGDLARYRPDGTIEFLGRRDHQVKLHGFRIELGEIESVLVTHPAVCEAVTLLREDIPGDRRLVAYVVPAKGQEVAAGEIHRFLETLLPVYMVPRTIVPLDVMPLSPSGKTDRDALTAPSMAIPAATSYVPPQSPLHYQLLHIWEELLAARPIGITDNFFELGGHSLLVARLIDRIERVCGRRLSLSVLFANATIEQLARVLATETTDSWVPVLVVRRGGNRRPFFFLHGDPANGGPYCWDLARHLSPEQPFYLLQPHGLDGGAIPRTIQEMAAGHLCTLRAVQPVGPYLLGGYCSGGLVAYEMAQQLQAAGERVDLLVLMDTVRTDTHYTYLCGFAHLLSSLSGRDADAHVDLSLRLRYYATYAHWFLRLRTGQKIGRAIKQSKQLARQWTTRVVPANAAGSTDVARRRTLTAAYWFAMTRYVPQPFDGCLTLIWPDQGPVGQSGKDGLGWRRVATEEWLGLAREVEIHTTPGNHITCRTRYVQYLAAHLNACLDKAQSAYRSGTSRHDIVSLSSHLQFQENGGGGSKRAADMP